MFNMPLTPPPERPASTHYQNFGFAGRWLDNHKSSPEKNESGLDTPQDPPHKKEPETQNTLVQPDDMVTNNRFCNFDDKRDYRDESVYTFCGSCKNHVMTVVRFRVGRMTVLSSTLLCLIGCAAGCCLVPFLVEGLRDVIHFCPNCQITLGKYRRTFKNLCHAED